MSKPVEVNPEESPRALFAYELRRYRVEAGLKQSELAERIGYTTSMVGMIETARRSPAKRFAELCDRALGLDGVMTRLCAIARWETVPEHFRDWMEVEQDATVLRSWDPLLIPGLFQIEEYARRVIEGEPGLTSEQRDQHVASRLRRKSILTREKPPVVISLIDESVLHRPLGGREAMRKQLDYLLELSQSPKVTIQVVPYSAESTSGMLSAFTLAELQGSPHIVYVESSARGQVLDDRATLMQITARYEAIRAEAHARYLSLQLIEDVRKQWI
ncbi:helix-turn-helix domain-containing protein [Sphaerisporangium album]|uniref:helix-turn-helix domain-containing protein n=1 Tax=Sphaerisporangium album TaxID=509200 RepID=UPI0015F01BBB|nr:helix-turn-helix transcriptional regulator [Sphaerisporangium album]